jgi:hypothetical protein
MNNLCVGANTTVKENQAIVKRAIHENNMNELGAYIHAVTFHLKDVFSEHQVMEIIDDLCNRGEVYNTKDNLHIKLVEDI